MNFRKYFEMRKLYRNRKKLVEVRVKPQAKVLSFSFSLSISAYGFIAKNISALTLGVDLSYI